MENPEQHGENETRAFITDRRTAAEREADRLRKQIAGDKAQLENTELYLAGLEALAAHINERDK
jgi:hypothetical protein